MEANLIFHRNFAPMEGQLQKYKFPVFPQDVDGKQHLRMVALESCILNTAGLAAAENGFGSVDMINEGVTWVLSRLAIEMRSLPEQYTDMYIETWVEDYGRLLTTRNFTIYDHEDRPIGHACSLWALMDMKTRRPVNLQTHPDLQRFANGVPSPIAKPDKIGAVQGEAKAEHRVSYSDIDFNGHTNSMKYVEWMLDAYPIEQLYEKRIRRFELNYQHEALHGEQVRICWEDSEGQTAFAVQSADGKDFCRARIVWGDAWE